MTDSSWDRSGINCCLLGTLDSAGNLEEVEGTLLNRGGGGDDLAGFLAHSDGVQGYRAEVLEEGLKAVYWHAPRISLGKRCCRSTLLDSVEEVM